MRPMRPTAPVALVAVLALAGCWYQASDDGSVSGGEPPSFDSTLVIADASGAPDGPVLSIGDAIANAGDQPGHVQGALLVDTDGTVRLCEALAESFPPQCGGQRLTVDGLDLDALGEFQEGNGVRWLDSATLFGTVSVP